MRTSETFFASLRRPNLSSHALAEEIFAYALADGQPVFLMLAGLPFSGKSTFCRQLRHLARRFTTVHDISNDDRARLYAWENHPLTKRLTKRERSHFNRNYHARLALYLSNTHVVAVNRPHLTQADRRKTALAVRQHSGERLIVLVPFNADFNQCLHRIRHYRKGPPPPHEEDLAVAAAQWEPPDATTEPDDWLILPPENCLQSIRATAARLRLLPRLLGDEDVPPAPVYLDAPGIETPWGWRVFHPRHPRRTPKSPLPAHLQEALPPYFTPNPHVHFYHPGFNDLNEASAHFFSRKVLARLLRRKTTYHLVVNYDVFHPRPDKTPEELAAFFDAIFGDLVEYAHVSPYTAVHHLRGFATEPQARRWRALARQSLYGRCLDVFYGPILEALAHLPGQKGTTEELFDRLPHSLAPGIFHRLDRAARRASLNFASRQFGKGLPLLKLYASWALPELTRFGWIYHDDTRFGRHRSTWKLNDRGRRKLRLWHQRLATPSRQAKPPA